MTSSLSSSIFKVISKAPVPAYLKFHFTLEIDGKRAESQSHRFLFFDQDCLTYNSLMKALQSMFPYEQLTLTWKLGEESIECCSDVELASKIRFDLAQNKDPFCFIVQASRPIIAPTIAPVKEGVDGFEAKVLKRVESSFKEDDSTKSPAKKKSRFNSPKDKFIMLTSEQRQSLRDQLQLSTLKSFVPRQTKFL